MLTHYILNDGGEPVAVDVLDWAEWMNDADRVVLQTRVNRRGRAHDRPFPGIRRRDGVTVSTVFLGIDHAFVGGSPVLWETMIFGGVLDGVQRRYTSRLDALIGHARAVECAQAVAHVPRRLRVALLKHRAWDRRLTPRERRAVDRFDRRTPTV